MAGMRQFAVTCLARGDVTFVNAPGRTAYEQVSLKAGLRYPADCTVHMVKRGLEVPLPFDCIPLVVRRGQRGKAIAA